MRSIKDKKDEELISLFKEGDKSAEEELLVRYKSAVLSLARRLYIAGGDTEDLVQEGMCGLFSAMTAYKNEGAFSSYAYACIRNRMLDAVKKSLNTKNSALNNSERIQGGEELLSSLANPEDALIFSEDDSELTARMISALSPLEYKAIRMYIDGATMAETAAALNKTYKQTDNAIARAKHKLRDIFIK